MNYSYIETVITIKDLLDIVKKYYKKKYEKYENVNVTFDTEHETHTSYDYGYWEGTTYHYYSLKMIITFDKKIGNIVLKGETKITYNDVENEVINILNEEYKDDEFSVSDVHISNFDSSEINYNYKVRISFKSKNKALKKRLI